MRFLILLDALSLGGAEKQAVQFADYVQNTLGHSVEIWAFMPGDNSVKQLCDRHNITTREIGYFRGLARFLYPLQIRNYAKLFNSYKPDVLLGYTNGPNLLLGLVWKYTTAKTFIWGQQGIEAAGYAFEKNIEKRAIRDTPHFISNSENGARFVADFLKVPTQKIHVIKNGPEIIAAKFTPEEWHKKTGLEENGFKALMVAHIAARKDHETLLKAWKIVIDKTRGTMFLPKLLLAGTFGNTAESLHRMALDLGIFPQVQFLGSVEDIRGLNYAVDLHILSSHTEGLPNSLLEAMDCSLPIVGTDIPGIREAVGEENAQYLAPPKNHEVLAEKILLFVNNPALRKTVGDANKVRIGKEFSAQRMCESTLEIINASIKK